jgi:hypothetical protein
LEEEVGCLAAEVLPIGKVQGSQLVDGLPGQVESTTGGNEALDGRCYPEPASDDGSGEPVEAIEHEEGLAEGVERLFEGLRSTGGRADGAVEGVLACVFGIDAVDVAEDDVFEGAELADVFGCSPGEARLADTDRTGEGDESRVALEG